MKILAIGDVIIDVDQSAGNPRSIIKSDADNPDPGKAEIYLRFNSKAFDYA